MASYPDSIATLPATNATDNMKNTSPTHSERHTSVDAEVVAVETELGINPRGTDLTVRARLDRIDNAVDGLTTADVTDSTNRRYVTDAQLVVIGNTSGTNTGDQSLAGLASLVRGTFTVSDLSTGVLTLTHGKALASPYTVIVSVFNNSGAQIIPDAVNTLATNSFKVDLTSYGTITGTWSYAYAV